MRLAVGLAAGFFYRNVKVTRMFQRHEPFTKKRKWKYPKPTFYEVTVTTYRLTALQSPTFNWKLVKKLSLKFTYHKTKYLLFFKAKRIYIKSSTDLKKSMEIIIIIPLGFIVL